MANEKICPGCGTSYEANLVCCPNCGVPFYDLTTLDLSSGNPAFFKVCASAINGKKVDVIFKAIPCFYIKSSLDEMDYHPVVHVSGSIDFQIIQDRHGNLFTVQSKASDSQL